MKHNDKIKNKLRKETSLPPGFDWEDMSEGISSKLANLEAVHPSKKKYRVIYLLLLVVLGVGGCYTIVNHQLNLQDSLVASEKDHNVNGKNSHQIENQLKNSKPTIDQIAQKESIINTTATLLNKKNSQVDQIATNTSESSTSNTLEQWTRRNESNNTRNSTLNSSSANIFNDNADAHVLRASSISSTVMNINDADELRSELIDEEQSFQNEEKVNGEINARRLSSQLEKEYDESESNNLQESNLTLLTSKHLSTNYNEASQKSSLSYGLYQLPNLPIKGLLIEGEGLILPSVELEKSISIYKPIRSPFSISLGIGSNYSIKQYSSTMAGSERNANDVSIPGISVALSLDYKFSKSWGLFSGVYWNRYFSKFNYTELSTTQELRENQLVEIRTSVLTGNVSYTRASAYAKVNNKRTVRHYNKVDQMAIPIGVRWYAGSRKLEYYLGAGGLLSLQHGQTGKTVLNGAIIEYGSENQIFSQALSFGIIGETGLRYNLGKGYYIGGNLNITKSLSNWSLESSQSLKPVITNGVISLGIRF